MPQDVTTPIIDNSILSYGYAKRHHLLVSEGEQQVTVFFTQSTSPIALHEIQRVLSKTIMFERLDEMQFQKMLTTAYQPSSQNTASLIADMGDDLDLQALAQALPKTEDLLERQDDAPVIRLLNAILQQAIKQKASDIHIETFEDVLLVRLRIDGLLQEALRLPRMLATLVISRVKVLAKLDIAQKRLPQDGRITVRIAGHLVDIRVATIPASHGERVVLRILDKQVARLNLPALGMQPDTMIAMQQLLKSARGIILVTGPTGSGKTTSLYAMLTELNTHERNILTVEDPIEYDLPGIGQTQVNPKVGMTFAQGLRAILRQDPDVVMVGEIRDSETAQIAVQASLTGHLVLSTLHTNSAVGAITRLHDMGIQAFLLSSSVLAIIAQRLVRMLCSCKKAVALDSATAELLGVAEVSGIKIYSANGCELCHNSGYQGRIGIYEVIRIDDDLRRLIHTNASEQMIEEHARLLSRSIKADGYARVLAGDTTLDEVIRVTSD